MSRFNAQINRQTEQLNQGLEIELYYTASQNPVSWSKQLMWVDDTHDTLPSTSALYPPSQFAFRYQPLLFPDLERSVCVPTVEVFIHWCHRTWGKKELSITSALHCLSSKICNNIQAPAYTPGQQVRLPTKDLPLQVTLAPCFVGAFLCLRWSVQQQCSARTELCASETSGNVP